MKNIIVAVLLVLLLSACSARDYHYAALNETVVSSKQEYHIRQLQRLGYVRSNKPRNVQASQQVCYTYPPALGGFTTGCQPKVNFK